MPTNPEPNELITFLLRDIPRDVVGKMRAAAAIHGKPLKTYIREVFEQHVKELERKGMMLSASKPKGDKRSAP